MAATDLAAISAMATALIAADRVVDEAERALSAAKEKSRILREESLPMAMAELELTEFKLATGEKVTVKQEVYASIPFNSKNEAFDWLEGHGFGGLIKTEVACVFGRNELAQAAKLESELMAAGYEPALHRDVHPQTLKAFLREQLEKGLPELPLDLFGARPVWQAKVTAPKQPKGEA